MLPCRLFVQGVLRSYAIYGHPGLLSQGQIRYDQIIPRFSPFESAHSQAEKFALNIEYDEFDELHSLQPPVQPGDIKQPLTGGLICPCVLPLPNTSHSEYRVRNANGPCISLQTFRI